MVKLIKRAAFIIMLTELLDSHMIAMHEALFFRICSAIRLKMIQKTIRKGKS